MRERLRRKGVEAEVESAGTRAGQGSATRPTVVVAKTYGLDISAHRSRLLERPIVQDADLVIGMERAHVRDAVVLDPSAWPRAFALKELVRRARTVGPRRNGETLADWLGRVHSGRAIAHMLGGSRADDVDDPTGGWEVEHEATARELADLTTELADLAWPTVGER